MYYGSGFTHSDVYTLPTYLRNFYYKKLIETKKEERKEAEKQQKKTSTSRPINPRFKR